MNISKKLLMATLLTGAALFCTPVSAEGYRNQTNQNYQDYNPNMNGNSNAGAKRMHNRHYNRGNAYDRNDQRYSNSRNSDDSRYGMDRDSGSSSAYGNTSTRYGKGVSQRYMTLGRSDIMDVQRSLRNEGYEVSVDGVWGPRTTDAIRRFQRENRLDTTGNLDNRTLSALNVQVD